MGPFRPLGRNPWILLPEGPERGSKGSQRGGGNVPIDFARQAPATKERAESIGTFCGPLFLYKIDDLAPGGSQKRTTGAIEGF